MEEALKEVIDALGKLEKCLNPFEKYINAISDIPYREMGASDRMKVAKLLIAAREAKK